MVDLKKLIDFLTHYNITFEQLVLMTSLYKKQVIGKESSLFSSIFSLYEDKEWTIDLNIITNKMIKPLIVNEYIERLTIDQRKTINNNLFSNSYKCLILTEKGKELVIDYCKTDIILTLVDDIRKLWDFENIRIGGRNSTVNIVSYNLNEFKKKYIYDDDTILKACDFYIKEQQQLNDDPKYITAVDKFINEKLEQYCEIITNKTNILHAENTTLI